MGGMYADKLCKLRNIFNKSYYVRKSFEEILT